MPLLPRRQTSLRRRRPGRQGQLPERGGLVAVARPGTAAPSGIGRDLVGDLLGVGAGVGLDLDHIGDPALLQPLTELPDLPIAGVGDHHRRVQPPLVQLIHHVQHQLPLGPVAHPLGQVAGRAPPRHGPRPSTRAENSRQSIGQLACSVTALTDTPSWQLAVLPSVPEYWRCTPTDASPSLGKPVSSTAQASAPPPPTSRWASRRRTGRQSQGLGRRTGAAPGSGPPRPAAGPWARSTCAGRPASTRAGSTRHGHAGPCAARTRTPRRRTPSRRPPRAASSAGVMPPTLPPCGPEGGFTHTPTVKANLTEPY